MNANDLINAIGNVDDRYILSYATEATTPVKSPIKRILWPAVACVAALAAAFWLVLWMEQPVIDPISGTDDGNTPIGSTLTAPTTGTANTKKDHTDGNIYYFNPINNYTTAGKRLVDRVAVSEAEFGAEYAVTLENILKGSQYDIRYRLEYELNVETVTPDLSKLSNGVVSVLKDGSVTFTMYVSRNHFIRDFYCDVNTDEISASHINDTKVNLYHVTGRFDSFLYAEFQLGDRYITCTMTDATQEEMVVFIDALIESDSHH